MGKSYSKVKKIGICVGNNTKFYKERRRSIRTKERQVLRDTLAHVDVSDFDDAYTPLNIPFKDDWNEPTDGTIELTAKDYKKKTYTFHRKAYITKDGKIKK